MKLTQENEKIMRKAKRYIRTFPLSTEEIRQIEEDITGMALESQERGEDFMEVIGKPIREFCEDLVYSIGGMQALGGRKLLRISGIYFQLYGLLPISMGLVAVFGGLSATEIIYYNIFAAYAFFMGYYAEHGCNTPEKGNKILALGLIFLIFIAGNDIYNAIMSIDSPIETGDCIIFLFGLILNYPMTLIYIIGARRNRAHSPNEI